MKIDHYAFGRVVIDGRAYTSDVIIYPDRVDDRWWRREGHRLEPEDLAGIFRDPPEVLVIGTGHQGRMVVSHEAFAHLRAQGMDVFVDRTSAAAEEFNRLVEERARVAAALHLTC